MLFKRCSVIFFSVMTLKMKLLEQGNIMKNLLVAYPTAGIRSSSNQANYIPNPKVHYNSHYEILVIKKGGGTHHIDFIDYPVKDNQLFFLRPGQLHKFSPAADTEFYFIAIDHEKIELNINFSLKQFGFFQSFNTPGYVLCNQVDSIIATINTIQQALSPAKKNYVNQDVLVSSYMVILLVQLQQEIFGLKQIKTLQSKYSNLVNQFNELIDDETIIFRSVKQYAAKLFVTPNYLNEKIKLETGFSASYWINKSLIVAIKKMLIRSDKTIKEISFMFGFSVVSHFIRFFKNHQKISPREFILQYKSL